MRRTLLTLEPKTILHIDECHAIAKQAAEELLLVLEEGVVHVKSGVDEPPIRLCLEPGTVICSTTRPSALSAPLRQRFGLHFHFCFYSVEELTQITQAMAERLGVTFEPAVCEAVAHRALGIPRICLRHVERVRDVVQVRRATMATMDELDLAMRIEGIDHRGLQADYRRILRVLAKNEPRGVSARSLALALGTQESTVKEVLEPPLIRLELMIVTPGGRRITQNGLEHLARARHEVVV